MAVNLTDFLALQAQVNSLMPLIAEVSAMQSQIALLAVSPTGNTSLITNGDFEAPVLTAAPFYQYSPPSVPGWDFSGGGCLAKIGSAWTIPTGTNGNQVVAIQGLGWIAAKLSGLTVGQVYTITLKAAPRGSGGQNVNVLLDSKSISNLAPASGWIAYSITFTATAISHVLKFAGLVPVDVTVFIDSVSVN